jgi:hypothetical protein
MDAMRKRAEETRSVREENFELLTKAIIAHFTQNKRKPNQPYDIVALYAHYGATKNKWEAFSQFAKVNHSDGVISYHLDGHFIDLIHKDMMPKFVAAIKKR